MMMSGLSILVTGGTGAFGQAFVQTALAQGARRVAVLSRSESKQAELTAKINDPRLRCMIGDIRDPIRVMDALRDVDICIHAAALKRVETCEADPHEAVQTNIFGSQNIARACIERGIKKAVFLSTDKAAAPNTLYGMTKAAAERSWIASNVYAAGTSTLLSATRYGNVLGSTGSVVPLWRQQAKDGQTLTITHPSCTRFWMTMDDAVELVLLALRDMRGGEIFVPKIEGASVNELAAVVSPLHRTMAVGLRPGEKLHETLVTEDEARNTYDCGSHYIIEPDTRTWGDVPTLPFPKVASDFSYRSDTVRPLTVARLREMVAA